MSNLFAFLIRVVSFATFDAMFDERLVAFSSAKLIFFDTKSIFFIESSIILHAFVIEFQLKILFERIKVSVFDNLR